QASVVRHLAQTHRNVLVVGDDAQSIYSFRAADIRNILDFPAQFADAKTFRLEVNYRSTPEILALANASIAHNDDQFSKVLRPVVTRGEKPRRVCARSSTDEARTILRTIDETLARGVPPQDIAVLFRAAYQSQMLEFELTKRRMAYEYRGGMRFFERAHVKDVLAFLRVAHHARDMASWLRVLGLQKGIGLATAQTIVSHVFATATEETCTPDLLDALAGTIPSRARGGWQELVVILKNLCAHTQLAEQVHVVSQSSYVDFLEVTYPNASDRLDDIQQLEQFAFGYGEDHERFFEDMVLRDEFSQDGGRTSSIARDRIVLSTIHQAKGLEWDTVFVMGLVDGQFPGHRSLGDASQLEEERRLFYVAVTRAKRLLYLTHSQMGIGPYADVAVASMFLEEVPSALFHTTQTSPFLTARRPFVPLDSDDVDTYTHDEPVIVLDDAGEQKGKRGGLLSSFARSRGRSD
ncbi:ATP-dependent helicase, partial [Candidatus Uhrbacteria bacterium]|nr:ATP-dependent helicase [Candidatus Uhrbacteria bacterium]